MRITLICPCRTLLNVNSDFAFAEAERFNRLVRHVCQRLHDETGFVFTSSRLAPEQGAFTKYTNLDQDHSTWFATAIADCALNAAACARLEEIVEQRMGFPRCDFQRIVGVGISIFDNTVSVVRIDIDIGLNDVGQYFQSPMAFEQFLSDFSIHIVAEMQMLVVEPFLQRLLAASREPQQWNRKTPLLRMPGQFLAFDDLKGHEYPRWSADQRSMIWSHRIYHLYRLSDEELRLLAPLVRRPIARPTSGWEICWGTTYLHDHQRIDKIIDLNIKSQYFYCLFDLLSHSQKRLLQRVVSPNTHLKSRSVFEQYERQENLALEVQSELEDFKSGLQDINRSIFTTIYNCFGGDEIASIITDRAKIIQRKINRIISRKRLLQQRFISFVLILVGGTQVLSLMIDLWWFTGHNKPDGHPGVADVPGVVDFDLAMNVVLAFLVVVAIGWVLRGAHAR